MVAKQLFVPLTLAGLLSATGPAGAQAQQSSDELPSDLRKAVVEATYGVVQDGQAWSAPNPAQGMRSAFTAKGVQVSGGDETRGPWTLSISLEAWGRPGSLQLPARAEPNAQGRRVEYHRGPVKEWYVNDERGLEQGFTMNERPAGEGPLEIVLAIGGDRRAAEVERGGRDARFTDRTTGSVLHYTGLRAWDASDRELEVSLAFEDRRLSIQVEDGGAAYPVHIDPWIATEEAKLGASDAEAFDYFSFSVALWGDTAVVGAPGDDHAGGVDAGSAYVFVRSGTSWTEQAKLTASDAAASDWFGYSVALWGDTAVVGAYYDEHAPGVPGSFFGQGSAYVFVRSGTSWSEEAKLTASDAATGDCLGSSVALWGETAVVGAYLDDHAPGAPGGSGFGQGSAYVFVRSGSSWTEQGKLTASDAAANDQFGYSVSLSDDTAVVGAWFDDHAGGANAGSAYVFVRSGTSWSEEAKLTASDAAASDHFGYSVALWGDTAVVGAIWDGGTNAGSAYVFVRSGTSWSEEAKLTASDAAGFDHFGNSVALWGDTAVVGASDDDHSGGTNAGSAYVFVLSGTSWSEEAKLTASDAAGYDRFGYSVALWGDTAVVGALHDQLPDGGPAGSAYVFQLLPGPVNYCTAGTSASGCQALLSATGTPSASATSGFLLQATGVEGAKDGAFFWGKSGQQANPWGNGTSFQCVVPPVTRGGSLPGSGTIGACDGSFAQDLNATWCSTCPYPQKNPGTGAVVQAQLWYRDPLSTSNQTTSLSDAIEFVVGL